MVPRIDLGCGQGLDWTEKFLPAMLEKGPPETGSYGEGSSSPTIMRIWWNCSRRCSGAKGTRSTPCWVGRARSSSWEQTAYDPVPCDPAMPEVDGVAVCRAGAQLASPRRVRGYLHAGDILQTTHAVVLTKPVDTRRDLTERWLGGR